MTHASLEKTERGQRTDDGDYDRRSTTAASIAIEEVTVLPHGAVPGLAHGSPAPAVIHRTIDQDIAPSYVSMKAPTGVEGEGEGEGASSEQSISLVHRGLVETEAVGDQRYVRAYQTVYASVAPGSSWKDTHQTQDGVGSIRFIGKGDTWVNFGNPLRALHYVRTYYAQAPGKREEALAKLPDNGTDERIAEREEEAGYHGRPVVRSFLVPYDDYLSITGQAISEKQRAGLGAYVMNVDKSKASDQYQVLEEEAKKLQDVALPNSLISYVLDELVDSYDQASYHGKVEGISKLSEKLGLPGVFDPLTIPMQGTDVPGSAAQSARAAELAELHELSFWMEKQEDHPKVAQQKMTKSAYLEKYLAVEPRLSELNLKYFRSETLPETVAERLEWRRKVAAAADAALIPGLIEESYDEGTKAMYAQAEKGGEADVVPGTLAFKTILLTPVVRDKVRGLTEAEIKARKKEAEARADAKKEKPAEVVEEDDSGFSFSDLFDDGQ